MILEIVSLFFFTLIIGAIGMWAFGQSRQEAAPAPARMRVGRRHQGDPLDEDEEEKAPVSKKELLKQQKRQEREALREQRRAAQEAKDKREEERNKRYLEKELEHERREKAEEERKQKEAEEKAKKEEDEYMKWKDLMEVEGEGEDDEVQQMLLARFIEYIQLRKVVLIEELAAEFNLDSRDVVSRLKSLEESHGLTGVIDDRGKFIYIPEEELLAVKTFIEKRGRITRTELAAESNRLISLQPSTENKAKIEQEKQKLIEELKIDQQ